MDHSDFKRKNSFEKRYQESKNILAKYPERIPIIVEKYEGCELPEIDKLKYLVPKDMTMPQFIFVIRKRIKLDPSQTLFVMVNNTLVGSSKLISEIYDELKDKDGFLYVTYTNENTFG
tara:strand:- start:1490 stop:1843 length:354 start_codon:yes stop_codon:yes gene_type:complete